MLKGRNKNQDTSNLDINTGVVDMVAEGTVLEGSITSAKGIRIDGTVKGSIDCKGKVVVGKTGVVEGEITCLNADIEGELKSTITVEGILQLKTSAVLYGDIQTGKLAIEPGATFTGSCKMGAVVKDIQSGNDRKELSAETA
jgi:cytoskeletal protein CcmA (bactofilin family)